MPFFRTSTDVIYDLDVPAEGTVQRDRHDEQVAAGDLTPVDGSPRKVEQPGGGYRWELADALIEDPEATGDAGSVPDGTISGVLEWVDGDSDRARQARDLEASEDGKGRRSLIAELDSIIGL